MVELAKLEPLPDFVNLAYAILLIVGGIFGFFRVGSIISLSTGLISGIIIAVFTLLGLQFKTLVVACCSLVIAIVMGIRFYNSGIFLPPGLLCILSLLVLAVQGYQYYKTRSLN
ncbi:hypothetical protein WR25_18382 isoform A [Diploscapter pachys]|uniref:Uncharacterized protein n=1 Tax=Diploscapter pachys TaxID=2018661 RepID=A0A2A2JZ30_9BILA|nr:hypothetical protein WR25_18382 isoform A [Diploscapter pachys]